MIWYELNTIWELPSYSELTCKKNEGTSKRFSDILGFVKKIKKNTYHVTKT